MRACTPKRTIRNEDLRVRSTFSAARLPPCRLSGSNPRKACNEQKSSSVKTNRRRKFSHFLWYSFATDGPRRARLGNDER